MYIHGRYWAFRPSITFLVMVLIFKKSKTQRDTAVQTKINKWEYLSRVNKIKRAFYSEAFCMDHMIAGWVNRTWGNNRKIKNCTLSLTCAFYQVVNSFAHLQNYNIDVHPVFYFNIYRIAYKLFNSTIANISDETRSIIKRSLFFVVYLWQIHSLKKPT